MNGFGDECALILQGPLLFFGGAGGGKDGCCCDCVLYTHIK